MKVLIDLFLYWLMGLFGLRSDQRLMREAQLIIAEGEEAAR